MSLFFFFVGGRGPGGEGVQILMMMSEKGNLSLCWNLPYIIVWWDVITYHYYDLYDLLLLNKEI